MYLRSTWIFIAVSALVASVAFSQAPPLATTQPADGSDVPVKQVVLFSSGVGYFQHAGTVKGNGSTVHRFKTDQINDILRNPKSAIA